MGTIRTERRSDGSYIVYGNESESYPLGMLMKLQLSSGWEFFPYQGFGKPFRKPTRKAALATIARRWQRDPGNP